MLNEKRRQIGEEDLSFLQPKLQKEGYGAEALPEMIREYQRYLIMRVLHPDELPLYSLPIDAVWHAHILFTQKYREFCDKIYGKYLDHRPYPKEEFSARFNEYFQRTLQLYEEAFGKEAPAIWHKVE